MYSVLLGQIEGMIDHLTREEQLRLIELLANRLREKSMEMENSYKDKFKSQLAVMASDPQIQAELHEIDREFTVTESDGMEKN